MASNLLDTIRANSQPQPQGVTDETQRLQTLLRARSGKSLSGGPVAASNLQETAAVDQANLQLGQVGQQAVMQSEELAQQEAGQAQQIAIQKQEIEQGRRFNTIQNQIRTDALLQDLEQNKGRIGADREKAVVAQVAQNLRLQNQKYIDDLQREGQKARLDDEISFNEELARSTFADNKELLEIQLGNKSILDAKDWEFRKAMGQMSTEQAYETFRNEAKAEQQRAIYTGIAGVAGASAGAYGKYQEKKSGPSSPSSSD